MNIQKILIVSNKPVYQQYVLERKESHYQKLVENSHPCTHAWMNSYRQHHETLEYLEHLLTLLGLDYQKIWRNDVTQLADQMNQYDLVLTVGGDGTFLQTSQFLRKAILMGVNSSLRESTGALCIAHIKNIHSLLLDLLADKIKPKLLPRLRIYVNGTMLPYLCLNEALFSNANPAGTTRYVIKLGKKMEPQKSSGIWIATGTGSTAAIKSAGAKPFPRTDRRLKYWVREPFLDNDVRHKLLQGWLKPNQRLILFPKMERGLISLDGTHFAAQVAYGDKLEIQGGVEPLQAITTNP
ncbi:MAG: NAD(+)/NADH kinase [Deltaproteobacteria bacterium]|nr:NAD(+)/NADH kinase [Deltaproteobacteria bacterium]